MSNINCSNSNCVFMNDGKCCLDTVTSYSPNCENSAVYSNSSDSLHTKSCPYYVNKI